MTDKFKVTCRCGNFTIGYYMSFFNNSAVLFCGTCNQCFRYQDKYLLLTVILHTSFNENERKVFYKLVVMKDASIWNTELSIFKTLKMTQQDMDKIEEAFFRKA